MTPDSLYKETIEYLYNVPMFEKQGRTGYKEGLENSLALDERFGHPHTKYRTIHIAGTNGKGSVAHTLAAILQAAGYKTGLYTSPHLVSFRERIRINGQMISEKYVCDFVEANRDFFEKIHPSFFEIVTAMAFKYFADQKIDIAVIETGLGGRLDCTNIITPILSVITNISYDHTQFLGNTLTQIAQEKAGIIKQGVPVVIGESTPETRPVFEKKALEMKAPIYFADDKPEVLSSIPSRNGGRTFITETYGPLEGELGGIYQEKNANTILAAAIPISLRCHLNPEKKPVINEKQMVNVREGFRHVRELTGLRGRWERLCDKPKTVCDTGHNLAGWEYITEQLAKEKCDTMRIVFGMVSDKDIDGVMKLLPKKCDIYFTQANTHRAIPAKEICLKAKSFGLNGKAYDTVAEAYKAAKEEASEKDFIFIGGSTYVVAELLQTFSAGSGYS